MGELLQELMVGWLFLGKRNELSLGTPEQSEIAVLPVPLFLAGVRASARC